MDKWLLSFISPYQNNLEQVLSCSKQFTLERRCALRAKIGTYFPDGQIKVISFPPYSFYTHVSELWFKEGKKHRDYDLPALIYVSGTRTWYKEGKRHRDYRRPAVIYTSGAREWYKEGKRLGTAKG